MLIQVLQVIDGVQMHQLEIVLLVMIKIKIQYLLILQELIQLVQVPPLELHIIFQQNHGL